MEARTQKSRGRFYVMFSWCFLSVPYNWGSTIPTLGFKAFRLRLQPFTLKKEIALGRTMVAKTGERQNVTMKEYFLSLER